jgi:hypothetical protein
MSEALERTGSQCFLRVAANADSRLDKVASVSCESAGTVRH